VFVQFRGKRGGVHHEHPGVPQELARRGHPARPRKLRLFDKAYDLEAAPDRRANLLITVAGLGASRYHAD
jgi:hypothetical protein